MTDNVRRVQATRETDKTVTHPKQDMNDVEGGKDAEDRWMHDVQ